MILGNSIRAILFDIGWTLIYPKPTRKDAVKDYLINAGYSFSIDDFESANRAAAGFYQNHRWEPVYVQNIEQFWSEFYMVLVGQLGIDDPSLPKGFNKYAKEVIRYHLYPETLPVLHKLRERGYLIAAISNWGTDLPNILEKLGLIRCFQTLVVSDLVGYHKPQLEIFNYTLNLLGIPPNMAVHVGDDLEADVQGARRVGIRPIWLDRHGSGVIDQSYRIQSLEELL